MTQRPYPITRQFSIFPQTLAPSSWLCVSADMSVYARICLGQLRETHDLHRYVELVLWQHVVCIVSSLTLYVAQRIPIARLILNSIRLTQYTRRRTEAAEMKLLRPLAGYTLYDHKQMTTYAANYGLQAY